MTLEDTTYEPTDSDTIPFETECEDDIESAIEEVQKTPDALAADACADLRKAIQRVGKSINDLQDKKIHLGELSDSLREVLDPEYNGNTDPYAVALDRKNCERAIERLEDRVDSKELKSLIKDTIGVLKAYSETV